MVKSHAHYMDHKHYTDIMHGHTVTDGGHSHYCPNQVFGAAANTYQSGAGGLWVQAGDYRTQESGANVSVNDLDANQRYRLSTESRYIQDPNVNRQFTESNDASAIENRPKNYTVKIWKRTA